MAKSLVEQLPSRRPVIEKALFEHYEPYAEAVASGELKPSEPLPAISRPDDIWPLISWVYAAVAPISHSWLIIELAVTVPWDEEHTLGLRFFKGEFLELCGSV